jgi:hypothetical protein
VNEALPQACQSIRRRFDAYLSGEISPPESAEVSAHLDRCEPCSAEFQTRLKLTESLKGAVHRSAVPPFLEARIRASLAGRKTERRSLWIWAPAFCTAAALAIAALSGWIGSRQERPWEMTSAEQDTFIETLYGQVADIMRVGLGDHLHCAYFRKFPDGLPTAEHLAEKIGPQYAPLLTAIRERAPAGHQVLLAHQCVFQDRRFIHIAIKDRGKLLSLVITRKQPGESFREGVITSPTPSIHQDSAGQFAIAGFDAGEHLAFVISDHNENDNLELAATLASPVQQVLNGEQG